jgi:hypothetical protein
MHGSKAGATPQTAFLLVSLMTAKALADGGMFFHQAQSLAQTRQEAVLAVQSDKITYVLRTTFQGQADEFAWVIPMPAVPQDVAALPDDQLFEVLASATTPLFYGFSSPSGFGCAGAALNGTTGSNLTQVEARGHAGIYDWAVLASTGSDALLTWLSDNQYNVPASAGPVLDRYIQQDMHFMAVRVNSSAAAGQTLSDAPPIQFTVPTTRRFYPMAISQISSASEVEVALYVLGAHRAKATNIPNLMIDPADLRIDYSTASDTNYETLFRNQLAARDGVGLVTEYASDSPVLYRSFWPLAPAGFFDPPPYMTRLRTVLAPANMDFDIDLGNADTDDPVSNSFYVSRSSVATSNLAGGSVLALTGFAVCMRLVRRPGGRKR